MSLTRRIFGTFATRALLLVAACLWLPPIAAWADEDADIVVSCHLSIGEFGYEAIDLCVKSNRAAREEVMRYPAEVGRTVARCSRRFEPGWVMVKRCVDEELAAGVALEAYAVEHASKVAACRDRYRGRADALVRRCVEEAIEAASPAKSR